MKGYIALLFSITIFLLISPVESSTLTYNAALNRTAFQSSLYRNSYLPKLANDGSRDKRANSGKCAYSSRETNPWWAVDLGRPTRVYRVDFTNRGDGAPSRSNNFIVGLTNVHPLNSTPTLWNYTLCGQYPGAVPSGATVSLHCQDNLPPFRYLIVQFPRTDYMNFCELEVIAPVTKHDLREVALNKRSYQVSTLTDQYGTHAASLANDGSRQTNHQTVLNSCAHSMSDTNPWWAVDLEALTVVARVDLTNRGDAFAYRSDNFVVGLSNIHPALRAPVLWNYTLCGQYPGAVPNGATVSVECTNVYEQALRFRYVIVQFPLINEPLNVCEIQVFTVAVSYNTTIGNVSPSESSSMPDENITVESNPFKAATIALSLIATILIIVAVILLMVLLKQRSANEQLPQQIPKQSASEPVYEDEYYDDIEVPDTTRRYQEHEMSCR